MTGIRWPMYKKWRLVPYLFSESIGNQFFLHLYMAVYFVVLKCMYLVRQSFEACSTLGIILLTIIYDSCQMAEETTAGKTAEHYRNHQGSFRSSRCFLMVLQFGYAHCQQLKKKVEHTHSNVEVLIDVCKHNPFMDQRTDEKIKDFMVFCSKRVVFILHVWLPCWIFYYCNN